MRSITNGDSLCKLKDGEERKYEDGKTIEKRQERRQTVEERGAFGDAELVCL